MTVATYWDGAAWKEISGIVGPPGPQGPMAAAQAPSGAAGGALTGTYPNPGVDKNKVGGLINVQRLYGAVNGYRAIANGQKFFINAGVTPLQLSYTPPVDCWWEVESQVGIIQALTAAYNPYFVTLFLNTPDLLGRDASQNVETGRSDVMTYTFSARKATWRLRAATAYTCWAQFDQLATAGTWQHHQLNTLLSIEGRAWAA
jgi:hypothetical protein